MAFPNEKIPNQLKHLLLKKKRKSYLCTLQENVFPSWCQEEDLNCVRERWSDALIKRREYLDEQIKKVSNKKGTWDVTLGWELPFRWIVGVGCFPPLATQQYLRFLTLLQL